jgi:hypothetical protein
MWSLSAWNEFARLAQPGSILRLVMWEAVTEV